MLRCVETLTNAYTDGFGPGTERSCSEISRAPGSAATASFDWIPPAGMRGSDRPDCSGIA